MSGVTRAVIGVGLVAATVLSAGSAGVGLAAYLSGSVVASTAFSIGLSLTLGTLSELLATRPKVPQQSITANVRGSTETHLIVLGERRVGGKLCQLGTTGTNNNLLWIGIAHSVVHPGGCEGIQGLYVNDEYVPLASLGALDGSTDVTHTGSGSTPINLAGQLNIAFYRGTGTQAADAASVTAGVDTATDYRRGICWTRFRLVMASNNERFQQAYPNGIPTFNARLRGWRVYDPRLDSTRGGSGPQRADNALTWAWSRNPALLAATFAIVATADGGCGEPISVQDWSTVAAAANICDELIATPAGNQPRFTCDLVLDTADARGANLQKIVDCMGGSASLSGGQRRYYAAAYRNPVTTIDATWLRGGITCSPAGAIDDIANRIVVVYPDETNGWKDTDTPEFAVATPVDGDGDPLVQRLSIDGVTRPYGAQYIGQIVLRRARRSETLNLPVNLRGLDVQVEENVLVDLPELGISNGVYRVAQWRWDDEGLPALVLRADAPADYVPAAFTVPPVPGVVTTGSVPLPGAPQSLSAIGGIDTITLVWRTPTGSSSPDPAVTVYVVERAPEGDPTWTELTRTPSLSYVDATAAIGTVYDYRVFAANARGQVGPASDIATAVARGTANAGEPVLNSGFESGAAGWAFATGWSAVQRTYTGGRFGTVTNPARTGTWTAKHVGASTDAINNGIAIVRPGDLVSAAAWFRRDDTVVSGAGSVLALFYDDAGGFISSAAGPAVVGSYNSGGALQTPIWTVSRVDLAPAPASAAFARVAIRASGTIRADDVTMSVSPIANLDDVPDGASFARVSGAQLINGEHKLTVQGSGMKIGDQRNLPPVRIGNVGSVWSGQSITYSAAAGSPATATISVSAATLQAGGTGVPYAAMSVAVTGTGGQVRTYFLFVDDEDYSGRTKTLVATLTASTVTAADGRIYVGSVVVTFPTSGTGGGGGSSGGGCVAVDSVDGLGRSFAGLDVGDELQLADEYTLAPSVGRIDQARNSDQPCVRLLTRNGAALVCSISAPIGVQGGGCIKAGRLHVGIAVATRVDGQVAFSEIVEALPVGLRTVRGVYTADRAFWAGEAAGALILHHNQLVAK